MRRVTRLARVVAALLAAVALATSLAPVALADEADFPPGYTGYHTYAEMSTELADVAARFGPDAANIAQLIDIGKTFEGRSIWALKISDNVAVDEGEPEILIECNMHAREHITAEQCIYLIHVLTDNYAQPGDLGARMTTIVNSRVIWIIPMLNPDGAMFNISGGYFHNWRKNRQVLPYSTKIGMDLNRNWSYQWGCCGGSGPNPKSAKYRGQYPFEATEAQVLRDFILSRRIDGVQRITVVLNVHSYGNKVLWPFGYTKEDVPADMTPDDHAAFVAVAKKMAALSRYRAMQGSQMYIYDGGFIDWAYGDQHIFAFTWEMYPRWGCKCGGFKPPDSVIAAETSRNLEAALFLFEQADCPHREAGLAAAHCV